MGCSSSISLNSEATDAELKIYILNKEKIIHQYEQSKIYPKNEDILLLMRKLDKQIDEEIEILNSKLKLRPSSNLRKKINELIGVNNELIIKWKKILKHLPNDNIENDNNNCQNNKIVIINKQDISIGNSSSEMSEDLPKIDLNKIYNELEFKKSKEEIIKQIGEKYSHKNLNDVIIEKNVEENSDATGSNKNNNKIITISEENIKVNEPYVRQNNINTSNINESENKEESKISDVNSLNNQNDNNKNNKICNFEEEDLVNYD